MGRQFLELASHEVISDVFDSNYCFWPALIGIDGTHYLCAYQGAAQTGWAAALTVDPAGWTVTKETALEYDALVGENPDLSQIDATSFLCAYGGSGDRAVTVVLTVDTGSWTISKDTPFVLDNVCGNTPALHQIDANHYLCTYAGTGDDGYAGVLELGVGIFP